MWSIVAFKRGECPEAPDRIFVVLGEQIRRFEEPDYPTHPSHYGFPFVASETLLSSPEDFPTELFDASDDVPRVRGPFVIKVFADHNDAISFAYCCNLISVNTTAYDHIGGDWRNSEDQSAFDIDW